MRSRQGRSIKIMRVYYVFNFDANLLSYQKLYLIKFKNRFDTNAIYLYKNYKNIFKIDHYKSVYVLT